MDIDQIIEGLNVALGDKRTGRRWVSQFILSSMSSNALEFAVKDNIDPVSTIVERYHLDNGGVKLLAKGLVREYWDGKGGLGETLSKVENVAKHLARNPVNQELLKRPEVVDWLNRAVTRVYNWIYDFAWES